MKIKREHFAPYMLLFPAIALLLLFRVYPMISTIIESFYTNNLTANAREFVGIANFQRILDDPIFWISLKVTFVFNLINIIHICFLKINSLSFINYFIGGNFLFLISFF